MMPGKSNKHSHSRAPAVVYGRHATTAVRSVSREEFSVPSLRLCVGKPTLAVCVASLGGGAVALWEPKQAHGARGCQISALRISAVKKYRPAGVENYSASSPSTPIRDRRPSNSAGSRATATASAPFTTGSLAAPMRRCPSSSRYSATFSLTDRSAA